MRPVTVILIVCCLAFHGRVGGQHYIGKHKSEVRDLMKEYEKQLYEDKSSRNTLFNMIKYIDKMGNQTLIYVFSEGDTCIYHKRMYDYSMLHKVVSGLNESYEQSAEDSWSYKHEGEDYRISLTAGDWFFTITTKPEVKD
jgi:hypothetical protein